MNRREALQAGLGILAATGIDGEVATASAVNPQAFVISTPKVLPPERLVQLREEWKRAFAGTKYEGVRVVILTDGMTLSVVDQKDLSAEIQS